MARQVNTEHDSFEAGDFIQVTSPYPARDFGTIRGTALESRGHIGEAGFSVMIPGGDIAKEEQVLRFNLNEVNVVNLFVASVARSLGL